MRTIVLIGLLAIGAAGCGTRVEPPTVKAQAAPSSGASTTAAAAAGSTPSVRASSTTAAPSGSAGVSSSTTDSLSTTVKDPAAFDAKAFCDAIAAAPLADIRGLAVYDKPTADAVLATFVTLQRTAPGFLDDDVTALKEPVDQLADKASTGQITSQAEVQDWIASLDPELLARWVSAQREVLAWSGANC